MKSFTLPSSIPDFTQRDRQGNLEISFPPDEWFIFDKTEKPVTLNRKKENGHDNRKGNSDSKRTC